MKANKAEIIDELEALGSHYVRVVRSPEQQERFLRDYLDDLTSYSIGAIKAGCKAWRHSDSMKFPTPGQLLRLVRSNERGPDIPRESVEAWRTLSDADYDRLSLKDKIRHQRILADQCRERAGPMWAGGREGKPATRTPERQRWSDKADEHAKEATRLREILLRAESAA